METMRGAGAEIVVRAAMARTVEDRGTIRVVRPAGGGQEGDVRASLSSEDMAEAFVWWSFAMERLGVGLV